MPNLEYTYSRYFLVINLVILMIKTFVRVKANVCFMAFVFHHATMTSMNFVQVRTMNQANLIMTRVGVSARYVMKVNIFF